MKLIHIIWNAKEKRLRTSLRLSFFSASLILTYILVYNLLFLLPLGNMVSHLSFYTAVTLVIAIANMLIAGVLLDRRHFSDFGLHLNKQWWQDLGFGAFLGFTLISFIFLIELVFGWVRISEGFRFDSLSSSMSTYNLFIVLVIDSMILYFCVGIYEELIMRGFFLKNLAEWLNGSWITPINAVLLATIISSGVFGWLHYFNPNATIFSSFNIALAGVFLAFGYIMTNDLGISIGLHIVWNFSQGVIFGFPVSGAASPASILVITQSGPGWLTGGAFGPEGGVVSTAAMLIGIIAIYYYCQRHRKTAVICQDIAIYQQIS